jgi:hypothetical protein
VIFAKTVPDLKSHKELSEARNATCFGRSTREKNGDFSKVDELN